MIWKIDERPQAIEGVDAAGRPDPAYAAALGLLRVPFGRRALSYACDFGSWVVLQLPLWLGAVPLLIEFVTGSVSSYGFVNPLGERAEVENLHKRETIAPIQVAVHLHGVIGH